MRDQRGANADAPVGLMDDHGLEVNDSPPRVIGVYENTRDCAADDSDFHQRLFSHSGELVYIENWSGECVNQARSLW